jgi:peptidoglycan/xylan/chitin deacetylase (PgdA/CDA1 family)
VRPGVARAVRLRARWPLPIGPAVAVLGWHRIDTEGGSLAVPPRVFARQMAILVECRRQFPVVSLTEARTVLAEELRTRAVVLTFDDAWADNHANALGPLRRYGLPAMLYAPSRLLGRSGYMTRSQLLEMDAGGIAIGAHSRNHPDLRKCSPHELESEIRGSKEDLEDLLDKPVSSFAYPTTESSKLSERLASRRPSRRAPAGGAREPKHYGFLAASLRTSRKAHFGPLSKAASMSSARLTR